MGDKVSTEAIAVGDGPAPVPGAMAYGERYRLRFKWTYLPLAGLAVIGAVRNYATPGHSTYHEIAEAAVIDILVVPGGDGFDATMC
jgi:hypothetical protein